MSTTPAGWYADTTNPQLQRYWDGSQWTEHTAPAYPQAGQAVFYTEFDGRRSKRLVIKVLGE